MKDGPSPEKVVKHVGDQTAAGYYHGKKNSEYSRGRGAGAENSSTEYEGPSLEEGIQRLMRQAAAAKKKETKDLDAGKFSRGEKARKKTETPLNQRIAQNVKDADARAKAKGRSATGTTKAIVKSGDVPKSTTATLKSDAGEVGKRAVTAKKTIARRKWREKEYGKENASTQYEGPSLAEQSEFIKTFLEDLDEGKFGDFVSKHKKKLGTAAAGVALAGSMALGGGGDKQKSTKQVKEPTPITKTIDHSDDADYKGAPGTQNKGNWRTAAYGEKGTKYRDTVDKVDRLGGASKAEDDETDRRRGKKPGEIGSKSNELVKRARTSILNRTAKTPKK
jgi:hypothetical protein